MSVSVKHGCTWRARARPSLSPCLSFLNMVPGKCEQATLLVAGLNGPLWANCCCASQHASRLPHTLRIAFEPGWLKSHHPSLLCVCVVQLWCSSEALAWNLHRPFNTRLGKREMNVPSVSPIPALTKKTSSEGGGELHTRGKSAVRISESIFGWDHLDTNQESNSPHYFLSPLYFS